MLVGEVSSCVQGTGSHIRFGTIASMMPSIEKTSRLDTPLKRWIPANYETLLVVIILLLAVVSRFYDLGSVCHEP